MTPMKFSLRIYRALLKLYPAGFREEYDAALQRQFKDDYTEVLRPSDLPRFWARTLLDFAQSMPSQFAREIAQDSRHALRLWRRRPLTTGFAIAALAIAIGANTGVFSVLNALLLRSLPFQEPDRLASLRMFSPPGGPNGGAGFHEWRQRSTYLADAASYGSSLEVNLEAARATGRMRLTETSWNFFSLLGASPVRGRSFLAEEDVPGRDGVAVIGYGLWQELFAGDPRAVGATIHVNGAPLEVVGVAPPGFDYPHKTDIWSPTAFDFPRIPKTGSAYFWSTIGRLQPGLTWTQARQAFELEAFRDGTDRRQADAANRPALIPLQEQLAGPVRSASLILMGGVALLLLLACANIANLLLARTMARSNELRIRSALGASRARLTQQLVTETLLLSLVATITGLLVARWTATVAAAVQPAELSSQSYTILDWRVLSFAIAASILTGLVFGVGPALYATRRNVTTRSRTATADGRHPRMRNVLIGAQVAITIVLLTGSLALGRAFLALLRVDHGFELHSIATMSVSLAGTGYEQGDRAVSYYSEVLDRIRNIPGVVSASATEALPLNVDRFARYGFRLDTGEQSGATLTSVSPGYFSTIGARMVVGREFSPPDLGSAERLAVVNEEFARSFGDPSTVIGRSLMGDGMAMRRIIGVVQGMRETGPTYNPRPQVFWLSRGPRAMTIVARVSGSAQERIAIIRGAAQEVDPKVPVFNVKTMDERLDIVLARPKFYTTAVIFFGGLGLLLAVIGVYGVVSHAVLERTREMGIRLALGTTPIRLRAAMLRQTFVTIGAGGAVGVALVGGFRQYLQSLVQGADAAFAAAAAALAITALVAAAAVWIATHHIAQLDVSEVLRAEAAE